MSLNYSLLLKLLDLIREEIPSGRAVILLMNERKQIIFRESSGIVQFDMDINLEIIKKALDEKHPLILNNLKGGFLFGDNENGLWNVLCLPLLFKNKAVGVIYLDRKVGSGEFSRENLELLIAISKPINMILMNCLEFQEVGERNIAISNSFLRGRSKAFRRILFFIDRVKDNNIPVFIWGESGTGKELVARAVHQMGARKRGKFVVVNCGAIPELLLESELFGYMKGAFTGAVKDKPGLIEEANGGTFFLDEIGDLVPHLQAKLLRLIQEKEIRRIGENKTRTVDVRFISATNKNLEKEIERGNFREDLYYRLKIISVELPPLRERKEDILYLLNHYVEKYCIEMKREQVFFSPQALELLLGYSWPGNVRELQNEIQRCLIFSGEKNLIKEEYLSSKINPKKESYSTSSYNFFRARAEFERRFLNQALARWNYNRVKTAEKIGLSRQGLFKLIKKLNINVSKGK